MLSWDSFTIIDGHSMRLVRISRRRSGSIRTMFRQWPSMGTTLQRSAIRKTRLSSSTDRYEHNPIEPSWIRWLRGVAYFTAERYDEAIADLRSIKRPINEVRGWLAASYAGAGRLRRGSEGNAGGVRCLESSPRFMAVFPGRKLAAWDDYWHDAMQYQDEASFKHLYDALRKAGLEDYQHPARGLRRRA